MVNTIHEVKWLELPSHVDSRGVLTSIESGQDIPFKIKRIFYMHNIVENRGGHAHRDTDQIVTAVHGSFVMKVSDGIRSKKFQMNNASKGLYIPRMIFTEMFDFTKDAVCLVCSNTHYNMKRSLRSWDKYLSEIQ